ncbi:MAG TPA: hypothetical protein V6D22_13735 [Candidatus Obscuribacterales bacterium]
MARIFAIDPAESGSASQFDDLELIKVLSFTTPSYWRELYLWCWITHPELCAFERVGGWAGQGGKSQFNFGWHTGAPYVIVDVCGVPIELIESTWWQRRIGLPHHYEEPNRDKRRNLCKKDQKAFCLQRWPWLEEFDKVKNPKTGRMVEGPDVWQSICIGYAKALDLAGVPLGQLA